MDKSLCSYKQGCQGMWQKIMLLICTGIYWDILGCLAALRKIVKVSDTCLSLQKESDVPQMCFSCSALTMICLAGVALLGCRICRG